MTTLQNQKIEISLNKKKLVLLLFISMVFFGLGLWMMISLSDLEDFILIYPIIIFLSGVSSVLFSGFCGIYIAYKLTDKKPALIIRNDGILDNSSGISAGLILWTDVIDIEVAEVRNIKFMMIIVKNPQEYINKQTNALKRFGMQMTFNFYGSPISISASTLTSNFDDLLELIQLKFYQHKCL